MYVYAKLDSGELVKTEAADFPKLDLSSYKKNQKFSSLKYKQDAIILHSAETLAELELEINNTGKIQYPPAKFCLSASELSSSEVETTASATTSYQTRDTSIILQKKLENHPYSKVFF
ncbi:hypothetical protein TKK_0007975 [Trichogramma kaykai]